MQFDQSSSCWSDTIKFGALPSNDIIVGPGMCRVLTSRLSGRREGPGMEGEDEGKGWEGRGFTSPYGTVQILLTDQIKLLQAV